MSICYWLFVILGIISVCALIRLYVVQKNELKKQVLIREAADRALNRVRVREEHESFHFDKNEDYYANSLVPEIIINMPNFDNDDLWKDTEN